MKATFVKHKAFFIPYLVVLGVCAFFILAYTKTTIHLYLNQYHSPFFDVFFSCLTNLGDGVFLPLFLLLMVLFRFRYAILIALVFIISGLVVQLLKRGFFYDIVRPVEYFKGIAELYLIPGIKMNSAHSFPSGHSATAFGIMICFVFIFKNNALKAIMFSLAALIAYSRVYLSQHFLIDIVVGSLIGTLTAIFIEIYLLKFKNGWLDSNLVLQFQKKKRKSNT